MSADLLSEFDAFYQDPYQPAKGPSSGSSTSNHSFFDDLLSLDLPPSGTKTSTSTTPTPFGNGAPWSHQSSVQPALAAATVATTSQWGDFTSFISPAEHKPALAESNVSGQDSSDDQWGDFESFDTAEANPASSILRSSPSSTPPQKVSTTYERSAGPSSLGSPQLSKMA